MSWSKQNKTTFRRIPPCYDQPDIVLSVAAVQNEETGEGRGDEQEEEEAEEKREKWLEAERDFRLFPRIPTQLGARRASRPVSETHAARQHRDFEFKPKMEEGAKT